MYTSKKGIFSDLYYLYFNHKLRGIIYGTEKEVNAIVHILNTHPLTD